MICCFDFDFIINRASKSKSYNTKVNQNIKICYAKMTVIHGGITT